MPWQPHPYIPRPWKPGPRRVFQPGMTVNYLTFLRDGPDELRWQGHDRQVFVRCVCGTEKLVMMSAWLRGATKSCGCFRAEHGPRFTHGQTGTPLWQAWAGMRGRVSPAGQAAYPSYAGVTCDPRWETFEGFLSNPPTVADGHDFAPGMHLARVADTGPYSPENARWRTKGENSREARERQMVRLPDGRFAADVARENGIREHTWRKRAFKFGWDIERAVTTPTQRGAMR